MNIEKLKNYNQKLLAILGTIIILMAVIGLIALVFFIITEFNRSSHYEPDGILSDKKVEELQKENKRQQLISYDFPMLVDTPNLIYIIPVSQRTLSDPEPVNDEVLGLLDVSKSNFESGSRSSSNFYGSFNNLLIFDFNKSATKKLFTSRINFNEVENQYFNDDILILFKASDKDSNKDGIVSQSDLKSLYIYSLKEQNIRHIGMENTDITAYSLVGKSKDLIIQFGLDQNKDGRFEVYREPTIIKKYDFKNGELAEIIDKNTEDLLQKTLEGTK